MVFILNESLAKKKREWPILLKKLNEAQQKYGPDHSKTKEAEYALKEKLDEIRALGEVLNVARISD